MYSHLFCTYPLMFHLSNYHSPSQPTTVLLTTSPANLHLISHNSATQLQPYQLLYSASKLSSHPSYHPNTTSTTHPDILPTTGEPVHHLLYCPSLSSVPFFFLGHTYSTVHLNCGLSPPGVAAAGGVQGALHQL